MRRNAWKWAMLGGLVVIILLYGMDLATTGIEKVNGPLVRAGDESAYEYPPVKQEPVQTAADQRDNLQDQTQNQTQAERSLPGGDSHAGLGSSGLQGLPPRDHEARVDRLADSTAGLVQSLSSGGIRLVVSLFDALTN